MEPIFNVRQQSEIYIGPTSDILPGVLPGGRVVVVSDATIDRLYHPMLAPYDTVLIGLGESIKTLQTVESIYRRFIELGVDRSTFVLGIGGGIVTDVAGFAAATYMRGLDFGFVSTTLLGQVDASVGGKNGVNVDGYKNMAGTFSQPRFVICDPGMLRTLSDREFRAGLAEVVKAAIIADADLFARIEATTFDDLRSDTDLLTDAISAAVRVKADIVERDEHETGDRRKLNLGHTLAHAIEKCYQPDESWRSGGRRHGPDRRRRGEAGRSDCLPTATGSSNVLEKLGFDLTPPVDVKRLLKEVGKDKKSEDGMLRIVLPVGIGDCEVRPMPHCRVSPRSLRDRASTTHHPYNRKTPLDGGVFSIYDTLSVKSRSCVLSFSDVGVPVGDGLPRDARFDRGACHGGRHGAEQPRVERFGNQVVAAEFEFCPAHRRAVPCRYRLLGQFGQARVPRRASSLR